jgi:hypothetical protein
LFVWILTLIYKYSLLEPKRSSWFQHSGDYHGESILECACSAHGVLERFWFRVLHVARDPGDLTSRFIIYLMWDVRSSLPFRFRTKSTWSIKTLSSFQHDINHRI